MRIAMRSRKEHLRGTKERITMSAPLHVIVGAGQIGPMIAERLLARGVRVRMVRRSAVEPRGVEAVRADVSDPAQAASAMRGASVVYHAANPRYHLWAAELLPLARGIVAGATAAGARIVALDNLYMYEVPPDGRLAPDTRVAPRSRKGALRARAAEVMLAAKVPVALARASDFFGPNATNSVFGERFWPRLLSGRAVEVMGDPEQPHTYSYTPDVADGLVALGLAEDDAFGRVWHLPASPAEPTRAWVDRFARAVGVAPRMTRFSPLLLRLAGLFVPEAGELPEMMYQWQTPFVLDDSAFRARFGAAPTPVARAVTETVAWATRRHARAA
jgi:nucleoside-diphosphate-sugar epimerase